MLDDEIGEDDRIESCLRILTPLYEYSQSKDLQDGHYVERAVHSAMRALTAKAKLVRRG